LRRIFAILFLLLGVAAITATIASYGRGICPPEEFVAALVERGLLLGIGLWLFRSRKKKGT
jgi:hypothetical protein